MSKTIAFPDVGAKLQEGVCVVELFARTDLPTSFGNFTLFVFKNNHDSLEHLAMVSGSLNTAKGVTVRIHSECLTGDVLGSLRCDCGQQLQHSLGHIGKQKSGVLLYMRQEGRGIGLGNKIRAYALQDLGLDTYAANKHLGFDADLRDYKIASLILKILQVPHVELWTNNPAKAQGLVEHGVIVEKVTPLTIAPNPHNSRYLSVKQAFHNTQKRS